MPHNHEWQDRIKRVEREYAAMRHAADRFRQVAVADPSILEGNLRQGEIITASNNLEGTYIIRLFAEFESGARQYWGTNWDTAPKTVDLLNGLAARREIPDPQRGNAHLVREHRNGLVHEREEKPREGKPNDGVTIAVARRYLCHFFSFLPLRW